MFSHAYVFASCGRQNRALTDDIAGVFTFLLIRAGLQRLFGEDGTTPATDGFVFLAGLRFFLSEFRCIIKIKIDHEKAAGVKALGHEDVSFLLFIRSFRQDVVSIFIQAKLAGMFLEVITSKQLNSDIRYITYMYTSCASLSKKIKKQGYHCPCF